MNEPISASFLASLLMQHYGLRLSGEPRLLNANQNQQVYKVELAGEGPLLARLAQPARSKERVLGETGALLFIGKENFPAPRLRLTLAGETIFEWQPGCWGYLLEYIEGEHVSLEPTPLPGTGPLLELAALAEEGRLLGRLHKMASSKAGYPVEVGWLEEWEEAIGRAERAKVSPEWREKAAEVAATLRALPIDELKALPLGFIHTDGHEGNLLRAPDGKLYMLDWELAGLGQAIIDVSLVLGWLCAWRGHPGPTQPPERYDFDEEYSKTFLANYQQERPLSALERRMLGPMCRYLMGWYAARDIERESIEPGSSEDGLALTHWALMRSVTPEWDLTLTRWSLEAADRLHK